MIRVLVGLSLLFGGFAQAGPTWMAVTDNCDGTLIEGPVTYTVHYGRESRASEFLPTSTSNPCDSPKTSEFSYSEEPIVISAGQDLCDVLKTDGFWYVAMTAKTAQGESAYSNEIIVLVHSADRDNPCRSL